MAPGHTSSQKASLSRSCRARLDLHNNRRRKRGESGSETYRSSARLERRLGEQLHQRISTRARSRRSTRKTRSETSDVGAAQLMEYFADVRPSIMHLTKVSTGFGIWQTDRWA